jgi:tetratricopeptide (TPR) repeat protein
MKKRTCLVGTVLLLLAAVPAFARGRPDASSAMTREAREREARRACLAGEYAKGVALLSDLFLDFKDPNYIFNQGRCYQQNERFDDAIGYFREYLRTPGAEETATAQRHIAECEALRGQKYPTEPASVAQPAAPPATAAPGAPTQSVAMALPAERVSPRPGSGLRAAGVVVISVGVAGVAAGLVLNLKANSLAHEIVPPHAYDRGTEASRKNYEAGSWVGYGVGAAGMAAGAILYIVGWSKGRNREPPVLAPVVGPSFAGAALTGAF